MQVRDQVQLRPRPISGNTVTSEPMAVQTVGGIDSVPPGSGSPGKPAALEARAVSHWRTAPITVDKTAGVYIADAGIFSKTPTLLPYSLLAEIAECLQQTDPANPNTQSNRVADRPSPIAGFGVFATRPYQSGEIIGFYTGSLVLRKPMPPRLYNRYRQLTKKSWQDVVLPLYCVWQHNHRGAVQYQTRADTYIAWSQVKIYNKGIELGIDGQYSGNPLRLLNHSDEPNTVPLPTVNPTMLAHIRSDGQSYVKADSDIEQCLLIPVLAQRDIDEDEELTFDYRGYGGYTGCSCNFNETGKDIVSNPETMMIQRPGEFPNFPREKKRPIATGAHRRINRGNGDNPVDPEPPLTVTADPLVSKLLPGTEMIVDNLCIPLSPLRLPRESDQDFADRLKGLVNRPAGLKPIDRASISSTLDSSADESDEEEDAPLSTTDSESDWQSDDYELETSTPPEEELSYSYPGAQQNCSALGRPPLPQKRPPRKEDRGTGSTRRQTNRAHRKTLLRRLQTAAPGEYPELIWQLFSLCRRIIQKSLLHAYNQLCQSLNARAIPHGLKGEDPEWTPELAYQYLINHGCITTATDRKKNYRLMPIVKLKQLAIQGRDANTASHVEDFCLVWLRHNHFNCTLLTRLLNLYGINQRDNRPWDPPALYSLINTHPLSPEEFMAWHRSMVNKRSLGIGLWSLIRADNHQALHALIRYYFEVNKDCLKTMVEKLNRGFSRHQGLFRLDIARSQATLLQYIIRNNIVDLQDREKFRCLRSCKMDDLLKVLTVDEKNTLAWQADSAQTLPPKSLHGPITEISAPPITADQLEEKTIRDFLTDSPEQRQQNLAKNLIDLLLKKQAEHHERQLNYHILLTLLNGYGIDTGFCPKWSEEHIYEFLLDQNVLNETTRYSIMNLKILKHRLGRAEDPKKEIAHFTHHWMHTRKLSSLPGILTKNDINNDGKPYTVNDLIATMNQYTLPYTEKDISEYQLNPDIKYDCALHDLPRRMRNKDKAALRKYVEQWLVRCQRYKKKSIGYIAVHIKVALTGKDKYHDPATLREFKDAFQYEVWNTDGLLQFILEERMIDFSKPNNFGWLSSTQASQVIADAHCPDYLCYAIAQGIPAQFISGWEQRCRQRSPGLSSAVFYRELAGHLLSKNPSWPYTHEQIRNRYKGGKPKEMQQLQTLLKLEVIQSQAIDGYQRAPNSLLTLITLLRGYFPHNTHKIIRDLHGFQIKIPSDAECVATESASSTAPALLTGSSSFPLDPLVPNSLLGRAGTVNWTPGNIKKLLALHDQTFQASSS